jgi:4-hydroxy-2-oxoheptanedioate aldolase
MHAINFDAGTDEYYERANDEILVVLQTESPLGVASADAIYQLPGCDAIFIGPVDLRFNMRTPDGRKPTPEQHEALVQRVIATGKRVGTPTGIHCMEPEQALMRAQQGMQFLAVGSDLRMLIGRAEQVASSLGIRSNPEKSVRY